MPSCFYWLILFYFLAPRCVLTIAYYLAARGSWEETYKVKKIDRAHLECPLTFRELGRAIQCTLWRMQQTLNWDPAFLLQIIILQIQTSSGCVTCKLCPADRDCNRHGGRGHQEGFFAERRAAKGPKLAAFLRETQWVTHTHTQPVPLPALL